MGGSARPLNVSGCCRMFVAKRLWPKFDTILERSTTRQNDHFDLCLGLMVFSSKSGFDVRYFIRYRG
jgi:hypothetical protein